MVRLQEDLLHLQAQAARAQIQLQDGQPYIFTQERSVLTDDLLYVKYALQLQTLDSLRTKTGAYLATLSSPDLVSKCSDHKFEAKLRSLMQQLEKKLGISDINRPQWLSEVRPVSGRHHMP